MFNTHTLKQRRTTFLGQGPWCIIFNALKIRRQNYDLNFWESHMRKRNCFYLPSLFIACGLILLPSELFRIVIIANLLTVQWSLNFMNE